MKSLIQWTRDRPLGYEEYDSGSMPLHLKKSDPTGLDISPDGDPGYVHHLMHQGTVFTADHYCVLDREDGGTDVWSWNDSFTEGERFGSVRTFYPLSADDDIGGAYHPKQSVDRIRHWAEQGAKDLLIGMGFKASRIGLWKDFPTPDEADTFHGLLVSNSLQQDHVFKVENEKRSWREWTDGVPAGLVKDGLVVEQRAAGRYKRHPGTQTFYARNSAESNTIHAASNENSIEHYIAAIPENIAEAIAASSDELSHLFTTLAGVPNTASWPNGLYRWQIDAASAGNDLTFGCLTIGGSAGHFARINAGATAHVGSTWTQTQGAFSGAGLHIASRSLTPPTGVVLDRLEVLLACASSAMHGNQTLSLQVNETDDFVDGPWATFDPIEQERFRWRNDDGDEAGATFKAALNTDIEIPVADLDKNIRLRIGMSNLVSSEVVDVWQLQGELNDSASWVDVTAASAVARSSLSTEIDEADTTTEQLGGAQTFVAGGVDETDGQEIVTLPGDRDSEIEFCFQLRSADIGAGDTVRFRLRFGIQPVTILYSVLPRVTIEGGVTQEGETDDEGAGEFDASPEVTARSATDLEGTHEANVSPRITAESATDLEGLHEADVVGDRKRASQTDLEGTSEGDVAPQITARPSVDDEGALEEDASPAVTARASADLEGTYEADVTPAGKVASETDEEGGFEGDVAARVTARPGTDDEGGLEADVSPAIVAQSVTDLEGGFEGNVDGQVVTGAVTSETDEEGAGEFDASPAITAQSTVQQEGTFEADVSPGIIAQSASDLEGTYEASAEPAGKVTSATDLEGAGEGDASPEVIARAGTDLEGGLEDDASPRVTIRSATTDLESGFEGSVVGVVRVRASVNLEGAAEMDATSSARVQSRTDLEGAGEFDANPGIKARSAADMEGAFEGNAEGEILEVLVDAALEGSYEDDFSPGITARSLISLEGAGEMRAELGRATWRYWLIRGGTEHEKTSTYFPAQLDTEALIHPRNRPADRDKRKASVLASRAFPPLRAFLRIRLPGEVDYTARDLTGADVRIKIIDIHGNVLVDQPAAIQEAATGLVRYDWQLHDLDTLGPFLVRWRVTWSPELPLFFPLRREVPLAVV